MLEIANYLKGNRYLIEEEIAHHSYDMLQSTATGHGFTYSGTLVKQLVSGVFSLDSVFFRKESSAGQARAIERMFEQLPAKGYDIISTSLPVKGILIPGKLIGKSYSGGDVTVKDPDIRSFFFISETGQGCPAGRMSYEGRHIVSAGHTGTIAVVGLYPDFDPVDEEIIRNVGRAAFGVETKDLQILEKLLPDLKIDL